MKKLMVVLCVGSLAYLGAAEPKAAAPRPSLVVTKPLQSGIVNPLQTYVGSLYYDLKSKLASEEDGIVRALKVSEGDVVKKGDLIVALDSEVLESTIASQRSAAKALEAELTREERHLKRSEALYTRHAISEAEYDKIYYGTIQLRSQLKASQDQLKMLQTRLSKRSILAPYDGIIAACDVEIGEWVGKGATVATLVATDTIEARVNVADELLSTVKETKAFSARAGGKSFEVTLKSIVPVADSVTRTFPAEFYLPKETGFIEGMRVDIRIPLLKEEKRLVIDRDGVIKRFGREVVFANVNGKAVMLPVEVVAYKKDQVAIAGSGLAEGMRIVVKGNERIFPNMPLMEAPKGE